MSRFLAAFLLSPLLAGCFDVSESFHLDPDGTVRAVHRIDFPPATLQMLGPSFVVAELCPDPSDPTLTADHSRYLDAADLAAYRSIKMKLHAPPQVASDGSLTCVWFSGPMRYADLPVSTLDALKVSLKLHPDGLAIAFNRFPDYSYPTILADVEACDQLPVSARPGPFFLCDELTAGMAAMARAGDEDALAGLQATANIVSSSVLTFLEDMRYRLQISGGLLPAAELAAAGPRGDDGAFLYDGPAMPLLQSPYLFVMPGSAGS